MAKIVNVRRISQIFFLILFFWFCITSTLGINWWQLRGWAVNWLLEIDPLVGFSTLLTTGKIYKGLVWGVLTLILTLIFGRFFCGWVCPFGTLHQFIGFWGKVSKSKSELRNLNKYSSAQSTKYAILFFFISSNLVTSPFFPTYLTQAAPLLLNGLLDPIPFVYRFVNLTLLPFADSSFLHLSTNARYYDGAWIIGLCGITALLLNLWIPRFYCRYLCPLGALFGLLSGISFWQIGKKSSPCTNCMKCQFNCEGACEPMDKIRLPECVLCMNCLDHCEFLTYQAEPSKTEILKSEDIYPNKNRQTPFYKSGQHSTPDISRRAFIASVVSGAAVVPMIHLNGQASTNWNPNLIRPPGSLPESEFLSRCIKCGQCMRVCPTNVIQPADIFTGGLEALWTPALNFRIGSSGCQLHCIACGHLCPTGAILPLNLDERFGINDYKKNGPIRIGTAFVDQGRCLPWSMNRPCIVCQENCPVSPKAIMISEAFVELKSGIIKSIDNNSIGNSNVINLDIANLIEGAYGTGDYFVKNMITLERSPIVANTKNSITLSSANRDKSALSQKNDKTDNNKAVKLEIGSTITIDVRLQRPFIDPSRCIGCGVCEHECPVKGKRAIRVTAENESRSRDHVLVG
ncbi:MAG: 4Fe-4S dicluster domain-containing protein [Desulfamplus sp.]|nr:4Fe-4S dicluster domain-containing protein [Desulfamplus sp.]